MTYASPLPLLHPLPSFCCLLVSLRTLLGPAFLLCVKHLAHFWHYIKIMILSCGQQDFIFSLCTGSHISSSEILCGKHSYPAPQPSVLAPISQLLPPSPNLFYAALIPLHPSLQLLSCLPKSWHHDPDQGLLHLLQRGGISWGVEGRWVGLGNDGGPCQPCWRAHICPCMWSVVPKEPCRMRIILLPNNNVCHMIPACPQFSKPRACTAFREGLETPASKLVSALTWVCPPHCCVFCFFLCNRLSCLWWRKWLYKGAVPRLGSSFALPLCHHARQVCHHLSSSRLSLKAVLFSQAEGAPCTCFPKYSSWRWKDQEPSS